MPSTIITSLSGTPIHRNVAITISLGTVSIAFSSSTNPRTTLPCTSSLFSTICLRMYIPSAVHLPFLRPCCSSLKLPSTILLVLASRTISNSFSTWLSSVLPLNLHIPFPLPYRHYQVNPPLLRYPSLLHTHIHTFSSLPVHLTPTSSHLQHLQLHFICPCRLAFFILCIAVSTSSCPMSSTSTSLRTELGSSRQLAAHFPFTSSLKYTAHIRNTSLLSVTKLPLLSLITAPLFTSLPSSVISRAIWNSNFCHHLRHAFGTILHPYSSVLYPPPSWAMPSSSGLTDALSRWVVAPLCL